MTRPVDYCLGVFFSADHSEVLLIRKNRGPINMAGQWNGIGGKIEQGETAAEAMSRELYEETGLMMPPSTLNHFGVLRTPIANVEMFTASTNMVHHARSMTDEPISLIRTKNIEDGIGQLPMVDNLAFLMGLAKASINHWPRRLAGPIEIREAA